MPDLFDRGFAESSIGLHTTAEDKNLKMRNGQNA